MPLSVIIIVENPVKMLLKIGIVWSFYSNDDH